MSVASEITRLQNAKADLKTAIEAKGVTVSSAATLDDYDTYVAQIPQGGGGTVDYLKITNLNEWDDAVTFTKVGNAPDLIIKTSTDGDNWTSTTLTGNTSFTLLSLGYILLDGTANDVFSISTSGYWKINTSSVGFDVSGDISSLCKGVGLFCSLFQSSNIVNASGLSLSYNKVVQYGFLKMFNGCSNLLTAPALPAIVLGSNCYEQMFNGCSKLAVAPNLPATYLPDQCYLQMFMSCSDLVTPPVISATTLSSQSCKSMFHNCKKLTTAPALPGTTLGTNCYEQMFYGCTGLTASPVLPAPTLVSQCYKTMFGECSGLTSITCLATDKSASNCTQNWVYKVPSGGTFYCDSTMTSSWTEGVNGYPSGWTVQAYSS